MKNTCYFCEVVTDQVKVVPITENNKLWVELCLECSNFYSWLLEGRRGKYRESEGDKHAHVREK